MNLMKIAEGSVKIISNNKEKILLVGGIGAGVGATVLACGATLKAQKVVDNHKHNSKVIKNACEYDPEYAESVDHKRDVIMNYANTGAQLAKMYAPSIVLGATSICCLVAEHTIMEKKVDNLEKTIASLSAAYIAVDTAFKKYRKRVVEKYGKDEDQKLLHGETTEVVTETDLTTGKKKKIEKTYIEEPDASEYARFFDCLSSQFVFTDPMHYKPDWEANIRFLVCQQAFANQKLEKQGYLFLNDVYELLGLKPSKAGQVVGWIFDPDDTSIDSHIDFGTFAVRNHRTINGEGEECILLDFNVDGVILDKIDKMADR